VKAGGRKVTDLKGKCPRMAGLPDSTSFFLVI